MKTVDPQIVIVAYFNFNYINTVHLMVTFSRGPLPDLPYGQKKQFKIIKIVPFLYPFH